MSEDPSMLTDGPTPSGVMDEISVTFLPQFLGAFPWALPPLGAQRSVARGERYVRRGFVHEDEALGIYPSEALPEPESAPFLFVSLGGRQRLFL